VTPERPSAQGKLRSPRRRIPFVGAPGRGWTINVWRLCRDSGRFCFGIPIFRTAIHGFGGAGPALHLAMIEV
jgi:hypothetical protein